jgi:addiction module HigA family antidote
MAARGWDAADLAAAMGCSDDVVADILSGKAEVSPAVARRLGDAFGTSAAVWSKLQESYSLWSERKRQPHIARQLRCEGTNYPS